MDNKPKNREKLVDKLFELQESRNDLTVQIALLRRDLGMEPEHDRTPERIYLLANVIVAIEHYLKEVGHAIPEEELVGALVTRGAGTVLREQQERSRTTSARVRVERSIRKALEPGQGRSPSLKEASGLIGLANWPKERFTKQLTVS